MNEVFYKPHDAVVGDVIPYYADGEFKLFYIHIWRVPRGSDSGQVQGWRLLGTQDFVHFREDGATGIDGGTGAVLEVDGLYHVFYCIFPEGRQIICHGTSTDLLHWTRRPDEDFGPDPTWYAGSDWRDPFVFWNDEAGEYWMLMAARTLNPFSRSGCIGLCISHDLKNWTAGPPLYAPDMYLSAPECPDLFRIGDWWYLVYSTYSDRFITHYRMSRNSSGPWSTPAEGTFDGRAFYAAKTVSDGQKRYLFGWNPTRTENLFGWNPPAYSGRDFNTWDWGGYLVVHELSQADNGTLTVRLPAHVAGIFKRPVPIAFRAGLGCWHCEDGSHTGVSPYGFAYASAGRLPSVCRVETQAVFKPGTRRLGLVLKATDSLDKGYFIQIEPDRRRVIFKALVFGDEHGGKILPHEVDLERPITLMPDQSFMIRVIVEDSVCEVYLDDRVVMSARMYDLKDEGSGYLRRRRRSHIFQY